MGWSPLTPSRALFPLPRYAYESAHLTVRDIDFFGLYDCFPICLIRAIEATGLAPPGKGGEFVQRWHDDHLAGKATPEKYPTQGTSRTGLGKGRFVGAGAIIMAKKMPPT